MVGSLLRWLFDLLEQLVYQGFRQPHYRIYRAIYFNDVGLDQNMLHHQPPSALHHHALVAELCHDVVRNLEQRIRQGG